MQMQEPLKVLPKPILKKPPPGPKSDPNQAKTAPIRRFVLPTSTYDYRKKEHPKRRSYCRFICTFLLSAFLILLLLIAVAGGLFYLWFTPKLPVFKLRPVHFSRFNVTAEPDGTCYVDAEAVIWLEVKNPNAKIDFYYGGTQATVTADVDVELGSASQDGFAQGTGNMTVLRFVTRTGVKVAVDAETGKRLNETVKTGAVKLSVAVKTKIGVGVGNWRLGMVSADVACGGVSLKRLNDGGPVKCQISWFLW